jgi:cobalt-zinc-cadmium efflux system membrane fusion protein
MRHVYTRCALGLSMAWGAACTASDPPHAPTVAPVVVERPTPERELSLVRFSPATARRLGLARAEVEQSRVPAVRLAGGEVVVPPGRTLLVTAPVSGELRRSNKEVGIFPGALVRKGDVLLTLVPYAPVDRDVRARAEREVLASAAQLAAAEARVTRLSQLGAERSVSRRVYEDAVAGREILRADVHAAETRASAMRSAPLLADVALTIKAPSAGVVRTLSAQPGQTVSAGASLIEIVQVEALQVRVAVYSGDLGRLDAFAGARVRALSAPVERGYDALPIAGPPTAVPERASVDRYFGLVAGAPFAPGERVLVELSFALEQEARSVPRASVIYDASGSAWVYACAGDDAYQRARIDPIRVAGERVVFARGPRTGTCVASVGASEIFGSEFEPGH